MLSSVGLYAVMAYSVTQRTQEIGVRMAVGAQPWQVSWLILEARARAARHGPHHRPCGRVGPGRVMRIGSSGSPPTDPVTFAAITLLLTVVSIAACLLPARRATRVDPVVALRAD